MNAEQRKGLIKYLNSIQSVKGYLRITSDDKVIWSLNEEYIIPDQHLFRLVRTHVDMTRAICEENKAKAAYNAQWRKVYDIPLTQKMELELCQCDGCCEEEDKCPG